MRRLVYYVHWLRESMNIYEHLIQKHNTMHGNNLIVSDSKSKNCCTGKRSGKEYREIFEQSWPKCGESFHFFKSDFKHINFKITIPTVLTSHEEKWIIDNLSWIYDGKLVFLFTLRNLKLILTTRYE